MKKLTSALAVAALVAVPAMASAQGAQVYGRIHTSLEMQDNGDDSGINLHSRASRVGVRGGAPLDVGNMMVIYQVETALDTAQGDGELANRDTYVGLRGDFGMLRLGRMVPPSTVLRARADFFADQIGDARNGFSNPTAFDLRVGNSIAYAIQLGGVGLDLFYTTTSGAPSTESDDSLYGIGLNYANGPLWVGATFEQHDDAFGLWPDSTSARLGASYTMGDLRIAGMVNHSDYGAAAAAVPNFAVAEDSAISVGGGASFAIDRLTLKGQVYTTMWDDTDDADHTLVALGADYALGDATTAYAVFGMTMNDDGAARTPYTVAANADIGAAVQGEDAMAFGVGLIHNF